MATNPTSVTPYTSQSFPSQPASSQLPNDPVVVQAPFATGEQNGSSSGAPSTVSAGLKLTQGWWMTIGVITAIAVSNTPLAPVALGIIGVALLYQTSMLLEGK
jgi:hypothetical protein